MVTSRASTVRLGMQEDDFITSNESLKQKWTKFYQLRRRTRGRSRTVARVALMLLTFQVPSQLYVFLCYIIPELFEDYDPWTRYYLKVVVWFCCLEGVANYVCCVLYDTSVTRTKDRPNLHGLTDRWDSPPETFTPLEDPRTNEMTTHGNLHKDTDGVQWEYCLKCDMHIPPRAHHCGSCGKCILKRDHHCGLVGKCIGYRNQRYFVVLTFYAFINGLLGGYFTQRYLRVKYWPVSYSWSDFLPPLTIYRVYHCVVPVHIGIMIYHVYMQHVVGLAGFLYFIVQMSIIAQGKTLFELAKRIPIKSFTSPNANFVSVFGNFWVLNFVFPMQIIFRQTEDGTRWNGVQIHSKNSH